MKSPEEIQKIAETEFPIVGKEHSSGSDTNLELRSGFIQGYTQAQEDMKSEIAKVLSKIYETRKEVIVGALRMEAIDGRLMLNEFEAIGIKIEDKF